MKNLFSRSVLFVFALAVISSSAFAQNPVAQCLYSGLWVPCALIPTVQPAQAANVKVSGGAGTTITQAFGATTVTGNTIACIGFESAAAIPVFTDADSNTFVVAKSSATAPGYTVAIARITAAAPTTDTITLTTTSGAAAFVCRELKGPVIVGQPWDILDGQQGTGSTITNALSAATIPGEFVLMAAGFNAGTVNATPALGNNPTGYVTVDASNTAVTGGSALAVFYAAESSLSGANSFTQTTALSGSETYSQAIVSLRPPSMTNLAIPDPCAYSAWTYYPVNVTSNTQIVAGVAGKNVYVCEAILPPAGGAVNWNLEESATSGNACATSPTGMLGGNTAALGATVALNGGFQFAIPNRALAKTATSGDALCLFVSAQATGVIAYVQAP